MTDEEAPDKRTNDSQTNTGSSVTSSTGRDNSAVTDKSGGGIGGGLAVLLSLIAIGIASYPAWESFKNSRNVDAEQQALDERFAGVRQLHLDSAAILAAQSDRIELLESATDPNEAIKAFSERLTSELDSIREQLGSRPKDWLFAEVEYLVRMANQRVLMESDPASALTLLQAADEIVRDTEGLAAHELRGALAKDIASLKAVNAPDVQGIYLELSALLGQVPALKRSLPEFNPEATAEAVQPVPMTLLQKTWQLVREAGSRVSSLVDFRRDSAQITPILPPEEDYYLRQNLVLKIQMAQLALLEGNQAMFEQSLGDADTWVGEHFDAEDATTGALRDALSRLAGTNIGFDLPDISGSLVQARAMLAGWNNGQ
jgi:uroporphyrin-3 C-methyltransferase